MTDRDTKPPAPTAPVEDAGFLHLSFKCREVFPVAGNGGVIALDQRWSQASIVENNRITTLYEQARNSRTDNASTANNKYAHFVLSFAQGFKASLAKNQALDTSYYYRIPALQNQIAKTIFG